MEMMVGKKSLRMLCKPKIYDEYGDSSDNHTYEEQTSDYNSFTNYFDYDSSINFDKSGSNEFDSGDGPKTM